MSIQTQQEIAIQAQMEKLRKENELMRKIGTAPGFFQYYFSILPQHRTRIEAFNFANEQYFELYGEYRYSTHGSFLNQLNTHLKK